MRRITQCLLVAMTTLIAAALSAAVPQLISYQGSLKDNAGNPVNGTKQITFSIYDQSSGPNPPLWTEPQSVVVVNGAFSLMLGSVTPLTDSILVGSDLYLGITVDPDAEMTPRVRLSSTPYSFRTGTVDGALGGQIDGDLIVGDTSWLASTSLKDLTEKATCWSGGKTISGARMFAGRAQIGGVFQIVGGCPDLLVGDYHFYISGTRSTIAGGYFNLVNGSNAFIGGGEYNSTVGRWSVVGGGYHNNIENGAEPIDGSIIGGGDDNSVRANWSGVLGGYENGVNAPYGFIGGGSSNTIDQFGEAGVVAGGRSNVVAGSNAFIGGGQSNSIDQFAEEGAIAGGRYNSITGPLGTIGGGEFNRISTILSGWATIGGGDSNRVEGTGMYGTVAGGYRNAVSNYIGTVGGGKDNKTEATAATVGGGERDSALGDHSTVGGGHRNVARAAGATVSGGNGNHANGQYATVSGGDNSVATGWGSTVVGGSSCSADGQYAVAGGAGAIATGDYSVALGGFSNSAGGAYATISGGNDNTASGESSSIGGGRLNTTTGYYSTVAGGRQNTAWTPTDGPSAFVGGGNNNTAHAAGATVAGGNGNNAYGEYATVPGGQGNNASGAYSFAAGRGASAAHPGCFVWADQTNAAFTSTGYDQFMIRAGGGVGINDAPAAGYAMNVKGGNSAGIYTATNRTGFLQGDAAINAYSPGVAVYGNCGTSGRAGWFEGSTSDWVLTGFNTGGSGAAIRAQQQGSGPGITASVAAGDFVQFYTPGVPPNLRFKIDNSGNVCADGTVTQNGGCDVAENMAVVGRSADYQPGDVLVMSASEPGRLELAVEPYSNRVAGIHSEQAGFYLGSNAFGHADNQVPIALSGVVPCKVTSENGAIEIGDLLVASSTPGCAMKATDPIRAFGAVVGKAMEPMAGPSGVVKALVMLR